VIFVARGIRGEISRYLVRAEIPRGKYGNTELEYRSLFPTMAIVRKMAIGRERRAIHATE
jgi:hypothetical protein